MKMWTVWQTEGLEIFKMSSESYSVRRSLNEYQQGQKEPVLYETAGTEGNGFFILLLV